MAGSAGCCGYGCRKIGGTVPGWRPVCSGYIASRHAGTVAVDVGTGARRRCVRRRQSTTFGCQCAPGKVGGAVHVGRGSQRDRAMAVGAGEGVGQTVRRCKVRGVGTDLDIRIGGHFRYCS